MRVGPLRVAVFGFLLCSCGQQRESSLHLDAWDSRAETHADVVSEVATVDAPESEGADGADTASADASAPLAPTVLPPWATTLKVNAVVHGVDGLVDTFLATGTASAVVRLRPTIGAPSIVMIGESVGEGPSLRGMRFGDAAATALLVGRFEPVGWNFIAHVYAVVEVDKGKPLRPFATHVRSGATRAVEVWDLDTGVGRLESAEARSSVGGGQELVQVGCGAWFPAVKKKPASSCDSTNRIFFFSGGKWWWDEARGTSCSPKDNGYCYPASPMPPASRFPPATEVHAGSEPAP